jgi:hypothetical protein
MSTKSDALITRLASINTKSPPTPGAIRAAEAITGIKYSDTRPDIIAVDGTPTPKRLAHLIDTETAAPELLEALKSLVGAIMTENGDGAYLLPVNEVFDPQHYAIIQAANAAIAKAEGDSE